MFPSSALCSCEPWHPIRVAYCSAISFSGNKFTQEIELIRNKTGVIDPTKITGTDNESALDVMDEISKEVSEIAEEGDDGLNPYQA